MNAFYSELIELSTLIGLISRWSLLVFVAGALTGHAQTRVLALPLESEWTQPVPTSPPTDSTAAKSAPAAGPVVPLAGELTGTLITNTNKRAADVVQAQVLPQGNLERLQVGVGDQIFITVFGQPDMSAEVAVNDAEQVTLPLVGTLKVGGLAPQAIEKLIAQRLRDGEYLRNPDVSVQVRQVRSQMISVLGEVQRPGRFPIQGKLTVLDALATAGGLTPRADRTVSLLRRNLAKAGESERQEIPIRLDQAMDPSRGDLDLELRNDDVVFVAQQKLFYIHGEVRRPGAYPMEPDLNIMRALSISGGVTERGSLRRVRIHRKGDDQRDQAFTPDLNTPIMSGDVIYVDERLF